MLSRTMPFLSVVLAALVLQTAPGDRLFVQATALNLRSKPKAGATLLRQLPIGSQCMVVSMGPESWVELRCSRSRGFGKLELLGPTKPSATELVARSNEPGLSCSEALNLLQRAVSLTEDSDVRAMFRGRYVDAEFERLTRARSSNDTMKPPLVVSWPADCSGTGSDCLREALETVQPRGVWETLYFHGNDVLYMRVFDDGLLRLWSGVMDKDKRTLVVQLESLTVPGAPVLAALEVQPVRDACRIPFVEDNSTCGYDSRVHMDDNVGSIRADYENATGICDECKTACTTTCDGCRLKCWTQNPQGHEGCEGACFATTRTCEETCQNRLDASINASESTEQDAQAKWKLKCGAQCGRVVACAESHGLRQWTPVSTYLARILKESPDRTPQEKILGDCASQLPPPCQERCLEPFLEH